MGEKLSVEQMCRELLDQAVNDKLVTLGMGNEFPQNYTAGELCGMANLLSTYFDEDAVVVDKNKAIRQQIVLSAALRSLIDAAEAFAADQSTATDPRCGERQPTTVAEGEALNQALTAARAVLEGKR